MLLWRGLTSEAEAMMPLVGEDWQKLAQARIACRRDAEGMQYSINTVPARLKDDPGPRLRAVSLPGQEGALAGRRGLSCSRSRPRRPRSAGRTVDGAPRQPGAPGARGRRRRRAPTGSRRGTSAPRAPDYADSEWVAGFIALTRMDDPKRAIGHFTRFQAVVATPISLGRAGYWLGLAFAASGDSGGGGERLPHGGEVPDELLRTARGGRGARAARRRRARRRGRAARLARRRRSCSPRW